MSDFGGPFPDFVSPYKGTGKPIAIHFEWKGLEQKMIGLDKLEARALTWWEAGEAVFDILEKGEKNVYAQVSPKMLKTGRSRAALTERNSPDAIREMSPEGIMFGTKVPYQRVAAHKTNGGFKSVRMTQSGYRAMRYVVAGYIRGKEL